MARRRTFRLFPVADLPAPHNMFKCAHKERFEQMIEAARAKSHKAEQAVGRQFLNELTPRDRAACPFHAADWATIAAAAKELFSNLGGRVTGDAGTAAISRLDFSESDKDCLYWLFHDPIMIAIAASGDVAGYANGQHRACALRFSGAEEIVVT